MFHTCLSTLIDQREVSHVILAQGGNPQASRGGHSGEKRPSVHFRSIFLATWSSNARPDSSYGLKHAGAGAQVKRYGSSDLGSALTFMGHHASLRPMERPRSWGNVECPRFLLPEPSRWATPFAPSISRYKETSEIEYAADTALDHMAVMDENESPVEVHLTKI